MSKSRSKALQLRQTVRHLLAVFLCWTLVAYGHGNTWNQVRYNGGTLQSKVDPKDWGNTLTVTSDKIALKLKDGQTLEIPSSSVTGLSYGQEAHRRVGTMIALGILVAPVALFGLFHKTRLHFIGIDYKTPDGKHAGLLLQGHKDNYRAILQALSSATGVPVAVSEKEREFVPTQVKTEVVKPSEPEKATAAQEKTAAQQPAGLTGTGVVTSTPQSGELHADPNSKTVPASVPASNPVATTTAKVIITSTPAGADIEVDGSFMGNTPSTVELASGDHTIKIKKSGFWTWDRKVKLTTGEIKIDAVLERKRE